MDTGIAYDVCIMLCLGLPFTPLAKSAFFRNRVYPLIPNLMGMSTFRQPMAGENRMNSKLYGLSSRFASPGSVATTHSHFSLAPVVLAIRPDML